MSVNEWVGGLPSFDSCHAFLLTFSALYDTMAGGFSLFEDVMLSTIFKRSLHLVSAWGFALAFVGAPLVQAEEFKPFLTLKTAGPGTIISLTEKIAGLVDPTGSSGIKAMLTPYKNLPGVTANGTIGLALQYNEGSAFGLDAALFLPISNIKTFNIPGQEMYVGMIKAMLKEEGNKFVISSPVGEFVVYQKTGYLVVAPLSAAEAAAAVDPKKLFADLENFTIGIQINQENISEENIEAMLGSLTGILAMQGMEFDPEFVLESISGSLDGISSLTVGVALDEKTLDFSLTTQIVPTKDSDWAEKIIQNKNAKTKLGSFFFDTPKTIFSASYVDYFTDSEIEQIATAVVLLGDSLLEGLSESAEEDEDGGVSLVPLAEYGVEWMHEMAAYFAENRLIDAAYSFDSDGTLVMALAAEDTEKILEIDRKLCKNVYDLLPELLGEEEGKALQEFFDRKTKQDYETVAGFSLSCLPNLLSDLPPEMDDVPDALKDLPISLFWGVKKDEAVVYAIGLDFAKTERTLKAAMEKNTTPVQPKQTAMVALKPFGEFVVKEIFPRIEEITGAEESELRVVKELFAIFARADARAKWVVKREYPNDGYVEKHQLDGRFVTAFLAFFVKIGEEAAQKMQERQRQPVKDF